MPTDPHVVAALRSLFTAGATPSRLIRLVVAHHPDDPDWHHLVQRYFREAFMVPTVRIMNDRDAWEEMDLSHWDLNIHLLHRMVENRSTWLQDVTFDQDSWLDSLVATDEPELIKQSQPPAEVAESWSELPIQVREYVRRITGNAKALHERVLILARLAEQLQQRVSELEQCPDGDGPRPLESAR